MKNAPAYLVGAPKAKKKVHNIDSRRLRQLKSSLAVASIAKVTSTVTLYSNTSVCLSECAERFLKATRKEKKKLLPDRQADRVGHDTQRIDTKHKDIEHNDTQFQNNNKKRQQYDYAEYPLCRINFECRGAKKR